MCFIVLYIKHQSTRYLLPKWTRILKVIEITLRMLITLVTWIFNWYLFDVCKTLYSWYRLSPNFVYLWQIWADCLILVKSRLFPPEGNSIQLLCSNCLLRYKSNFSRILLQINLYWKFKFINFHFFCYVASSKSTCNTQNCFCYLGIPQYPTPSGNNMRSQWILSPFRTGLVFFSKESFPLLIFLAIVSVKYRMCGA